MSRSSSGEQAGPRQAPPPKGQPHSLAPFRNRTFLAIWIATLCSNLGVWMQMVAAAWLMTSLTTDADLVALVQTAVALPTVLFALPAGALADLRDRRLVFLTGQIVLCAGAVVLAIGEAAETLTPLLLLVLVFLSNSGSAIRYPAFMASIGELVGREDLPAAIALNSLSVNLARTAGPALGGILLASLGVRETFIVAAVLGVPIILVLLAWRRKGRSNDLPRERLIPAMRLAVRYVVGTPAIAAVLLSCLVFTGFSAAIWALLPLIAKVEMSGGPSTYGLMLASLGAGAVGGALAMSRLRRHLGASGAMVAAILLFAVSMTALATVRSVEMATPFLVLAGASYVVTLSSCNATVQLASAEWVKSRSVAMFFMTVFGGLAGGSWLWGFLADIAGIRAALAAAGVGLAPLALAVLRYRITVEATDLTPIPNVGRPVLAPGVDPGTGKVAVILEYRIDRIDVAAFAGAMRRVRRIRLRDGAISWTLYQDAADPERWVEAFTVGSWDEDRRRVGRLTLADRDVFETAFRLHRGPERPRAAHLIARAW